MLAAMAFVVIYGISYFQANRNAELADRIELKAFPAVRLSHQFETLTLQIQHQFQTSIVLQDADMLLEADELCTRQESLQDSLRRLLPEHAVLLLETNVAFKSYYELARALTLQLIASELDEEQFPKVEEMNRRYENLNNLQLELASRLEGGMNVAFLDARGSRASSQVHMRLAIVFCLGMLVMITIGLISSVLRPLRRITAVTESIAHGKLDAVFDYQSNDELGRLADSVRRMQQALIADISERERVEAALRASEERYRGIFEHATAGIIRSSPEGKVITANLALVKMLGYDSDDQARSAVTDIGAQVYRDPEERKQVMSALSKNGQFAGEFVFRRRDNSDFFVEMSLWAERGEDGSVKAIEGIVTDISDRKATELALKNAMSDLERSYALLEKTNEELSNANLEIRLTQAQLVQSEKMASMGRFVAGMSHEFNNPISAVQSSSMNIRSCVAKLESSISGLPDSEHTKNINRLLSLLLQSEKIVTEGSNRVARIVAKMKSFVKLDEAERQLFDVNNNIEDTLAVFEQERKQDIEIVKELGEVPRILCYPAKLNQMFMQLLSNANQAVTANGRIRIRTFTQSTNVVVEICDNGVGIPQDKLARIFDPGYTTWGVGVGVGLGLSIVHQIVQEHNGGIQVESVVNEGTIFRVTLPTE
ncbi:MAG: PAS domain S-box protein [bacterium]|nr:PAS domain S-box protein [bacterium]